MSKTETLPCDRDLIWIIEESCNALRDIIGAKRSASGLLGEDKTTLRQVIANGDDEAIRSSVTCPTPFPDSIADLTKTGEDLRLHLNGLAEKDLRLSDLQPNEPLLTVPIATESNVYGWICLAGKIGSEKFSSKDKAIAKAAARQTAIAYESALESRRAQCRIEELEKEIAEHKRLEEALWSSEEHFRSLIENSLDIITLINSDGTIRYESPSVKIVLGYEPDELIGRNVFELFHPDDVETIFNLFMKNIGKPGVIELAEVRFRHKDGTWRILESMGKNLLKDPTIKGAVIHSRDVTNRRVIERDLINSRKKYEDLVNNVDGIVWEADAKTFRFNFVSQQAERLLGYPVERWLNEPTFWPDHLHPEDRKWAPEFCAKAARDIGDHEFEYRMIAENGSVVWLRDIVTVICKDGEPSLLRGIMIDMTERKQIVNALIENEERYRIIAETASDAIITIDEESSILFVNSAAEKIFGYDAEEMLGKNLTMLMPECMRALHLDGLSKHISTNDKMIEWRRLELSGLRKNGEEIFLEISFGKFSKNGRTLFSGICRDVTEKKRLETQFLRAQRVESIGTLASGIAHDLNNVLTPILMSVQMLLKRNSDARNLQLLTTVEETTQRGAELVKQILSFARGYEGGSSIMQIKHVINEIQKIVKETFPKTIEVDFDVPNDLWVLSGDATQLHQVFMNLCVNARDAMPHSGKLSITAKNFFIDENYARMNIDAKVGPYIIITVADTGIGIPPAAMDRIFEPFFTTKEFGKGTGLGLSAVLGIIKSHNGFINAYSEPNRGTKFKIYLPAIENAETKCAQESRKALPQGSGELVLVVDDELSIREITKATLEAANYRVITAADGIDAVASYAENCKEIKAVLTDMMMPNMDGMATIHALKRIDSKVNIIAFSGLSTKDKVERIKALGVKTFLPKPHTIDQLLNALRATLDEVAE